MEKDKHKCSMCGSQMAVVGKENIGNAIYYIFKCEKCKRKAAKSYE